MTEREKADLWAACATGTLCLLFLSVMLLYMQGNELDEANYRATDAQTRAITAEKAVLAKGRK